MASPGGGATTVGDGTADTGCGKAILTAINH